MPSAIAPQVTWSGQPSGTVSCTMSVITSTPEGMAMAKTRHFILKRFEKSALLPKAVVGVGGLMDKSGRLLIR